MENKQEENNKEAEKSEREQRIRQITHLYYSRPEIQKAIFEFSQQREVVPRYFEGFGKRPDSLQYPSDVFELVKKGATSFHCSEEIWQEPLKLSTELTEAQFNELRIGWDLLIDIDSKYLDYSKIAAEIIIKFLEFNGVKNIGLKFSGSKGFHLIVPFKAFPKEINNVQAKDMFPEWPRIILKYIIEKIKPHLIEKVTKLISEKQSKYIKDFDASKQVVPDIILVSPRHLFRIPYSLHEKTALASVVIGKTEIKDFQPKDAGPLKVKIKNFLPDCKQGEASELLMQALDWYRETGQWDEPATITEFKPVKLAKISNEFFPPSIQKILQGVADGKKRALFILINLFRSIGMEKEELEKRIEDWNNKNQMPLKNGYIKSQLSWSYRNKIVPPPNFDKDYYAGIGIIPTQEEKRYKNPINYVIKKALQLSNPDNPVEKHKPEV
ncbi:hypothetical protein J4225_03695 [Candidatus Pacearchaeota archaeon]|nr:hypothetical protein [Candidatus Pacearchaeota archaeon]